VKAEATHAEAVVRFDPLATRLADGDPWAPRDLVERHYLELHRYAFAMLRDEEGARDAVQDAFERALEALGRYPEARVRSMMLRAWLYRITLNVVRNRVRRAREVTVGDLPLDARADAGIEDRLDVLAALERLPERQRTAVTLRYLQDLPYAEISATTGWPQNTARTLVRRGLEQLRSLLHTDDQRDGDRDE
jgi:RNA polymerase sigma-70 factor, ECF subfamily